MAHGKPPWDEATVQGDARFFERPVAAETLDRVQFMPDPAMLVSSCLGQLTIRAWFRVDRHFDEFITHHVS